MKVTTTLIYTESLASLFISQLVALFEIQNQKFNISSYVKLIH